MAYSASVSGAPTTGSFAMYTLISTLITAGWTKVADSDGTTYSSSGVQVTGGGTGTNGLGNTNAWVRMAAPSVSGQIREITIQRGTTDVLWRIKYGAAARFTGGSPAAAVTPSSADEVFMIGGGTDASPTFLTFMNTNATYRWHVMCGGAAEFYSFIAWAATNGTGVALNGLCLDVLVTGSYPASDVDPAVFYCSAVNSFANIEELVSGTLNITNTTNPARLRAWMGATSAAGAATTATNSQSVAIPYYGGNLLGGSTSAGTNPFNGLDATFSAVYARTGTTSPLGPKGVSTLFRLGSVARGQMDTLDRLTTKDMVCLGTAKVWGPWNGSTPVL